MPARGIRLHLRRTLSQPGAGRGVGPATNPNQSENMKTNPRILVSAAALLAGCATPFRAPADVAHITLARTDSALVRVEKIWLERKAGPLVVTGYVVERDGTADTSGTHLDVTLSDADGRILRSTVEQFEPRRIHARFRRHNDATYRVPLDPLPPGTVRIEVRAHEGSHGSGQG